MGSLGCTHHWVRTCWREDRHENPVWSQISLKAHRTLILGCESYLTLLLWESNLGVRPLPSQLQIGDSSLTLSAIVWRYLRESILGSCPLLAQLQFKETSKDLPKSWFYQNKASFSSLFSIAKFHSYWTHFWHQSSINGCYNIKASPSTLVMTVNRQFGHILGCEIKGPSIGRASSTRLA